MTLEQLIQQRVDRLETVPDRLKTVVDSNNERLFKEALRMLSNLDRAPDGKIVASKQNLAKVQSLLSELKSVFFNEEYVKAIQLFVAEINVQAGINNKILEATVGTFNNKELYNSVIKQSQKNALLLLDENAVAANFIQPLEEMLTNATVTSIDYTKAVETLRSKMAGPDAVYSKYAGQITKDLFATADRNYVQLTAKAHAIEFYKFAGGKIEDTRVFCRERAGKVFHEKEIEAWGNFENTQPGIFQRPRYLYKTKAGIKVYWEGMNYDTNGATIKSYLGGYNCLHVLQPLATEYVSETDKQRAKDLGYFTEPA